MACGEWWATPAVVGAGTAVGVGGVADRRGVRPCAHTHTTTIKAPTHRFAWKLHTRTHTPSRNHRDEMQVD